MTKRNIGKAWILMLAVVLLSSVAYAQGTLPISIDKVEVNDQELFTTATNRFDIQRGGEFDVEIVLTPAADVKDMEITAFLSGYEYSSFQPISETTSVFDADANVTYVKRLLLHLSDEADEDDYKLRLLFTDRNSGTLVKEYRLKVDVPRNSLVIEDVVIYPGSSVEAGKALLTTVRVENKGERKQESVKVQVAIPALGIAASDYIDEIKADKEEETEEIFLQIPKCTEAGTYPVEVSIVFDEGFRTLKETSSIRVTESGSCPLNAASEDEDDDEADDEKTPVVVVNSQINIPQPEPAQDAKSGNIRSVLEVILIVLLVVLVIVGIVVGVSKLREGSDEDEEEF